VPSRIEYSGNDLQGTRTICTCSPCRGRCINYPEYRKRKMTDPRDQLWYPKTYMRVDRTGKNRRYLSGPCEECGLPHEITWGNFTRVDYKFLHMKCGQDRWNRHQTAASQSVPKEKIAQRQMYKYKKGAEARGFSFSLDLDQFIEISEKDCHFCGAAPSMIKTEMRAERLRTYPLFVYNGIDRFDNSVGYEYSNCVPCCTTCNFIKCDTPKDIWIKFLEGVCKTWPKNQKN